MVLIQCAVVLVQCVVVVVQCIVVLVQCVVVLIQCVVVFFLSVNLRKFLNKFVFLLHIHIVSSSHYVSLTNM